MGGVNLNINMQSKANHTYTLGKKKEKEKEKKINPKRKFQDSKGERLRDFFDCFDKNFFKKI